MHFSINFRAALLSILLWFEASAQNVQTAWRDINLEQGKIATMVSCRDGGHFAFLADRKKLIMERYDSKQHRLFSNPITIPRTEEEFQDEKLQAQAVEAVGDRIYVFTSTFEAGTRYFFISTLSKTGAFHAPVKMVSKVDNLFYHQGRFSVSLSPDSTLALVSNMHIAGGNQREKLVATVVRLENLETLWSNVIELPYKDRQVGLDKYIVDNNGNLAVTAMVKLTAGYHPHFYAYEADFRWAVFHYDYKKDSTTEHMLNLHGIYITSVVALFDNANDLHIAGILQSDVRANFEGYFYVSVDGPSRLITRTLLKTLPYEWFEPFAPDDLPRTVLHDIVLQPNGNTVLVAEQYFTTDSAVQSTKALTCYRTGPVHMFCIDTADNVVWFNSIAKRQYISKEGEFASYRMLQKGTDLYFIYNDHVKNRQSKSPKEIHTYRGSRNSDVVIAKVNEHGLTTKTYAAQTDESKISFNAMPVHCTMLDDHTALMIGGTTTGLKYNRQEKFLLIDLN